MKTDFTGIAGDFTVTGTGFDNECRRAWHVKVIDKNKIFIVLNGSVEGEKRLIYDLHVSGLGCCLPDQKQVLAATVIEDYNKQIERHIKCWINKDGRIRIEHPEPTKTNLYGIKGYLATNDYPAFYLQEN